MGQINPVLGNATVLCQNLHKFDACQIYLIYANCLGWIETLHVVQGVCRNLVYGAVGTIINKLGVSTDKYVQGFIRRKSFT